MLDLKITGGLILDGTGAAARRADIGITGDRIVDVADDLSRAEAATCLDASGKLVCPGFIDVHSHSDAYLLIEPSAPSKLYQGITTEVVGNCGASAAPLAERSYLPSDWADKSYPGPWKTVADYVALLEQSRPAPNVALLIGHGKLRSWVMGCENRPATPDDIKAMARLLDECLDQGGRGMSTGLIYAPGMYATREELIALAAVAARHGGLYTSHMRSEAKQLLEAIDEALAIGRQAGIRVQISHLKTAGASNWHLLEPAIARIDRARAEGVEVCVDRYPYTAANTDLDVIFPEWASAGGKAAVLARLREPAGRKRLCDALIAGRSPDYWKTVVIGSTHHPESVRFRGCPLPEVAAALGLHPAEAAVWLIEKDELRTGGFFFGMSEENMWRIFALDYCMLGTDASLRASTGPLSLDHPHPRAYGSVPRFLRASLDGKTVPLAEAIRKMTSLPAAHFRLKDRGLLARQALADVVVFDPAALRDTATYGEPHQLAQGVEWVIVNGIVTLDPKGLTGHRAGRVLR
ncbi:MAG: D-aminoacylase [Lentisphaerae bacterium]|nr:D-aminoacylase [Lentisphaerota bacterium]